MKYNGVVTNFEQDFTDEEKALGRKNIGCGGISVLEQDSVPVYSGDLVLGRRTGGSRREIAVKLRDAVYGDSLAGYLVPPRTFKGTNLVCDASGNITWDTQPPRLQGGLYTWIDDHYHINVSGLQEYLEFSYTPESAISAINGSALNGSEAPHYSGGDYVNIAGLIINVTGLQPSGDYIERDEFESGMSGKLDASAYTAPVQSDWNQNDDEALDYIKNKPDSSQLLEGPGISITASGNDFMISSTASGDVSKEYVDDKLAGKLDTSAYTAPVQSDWNQNDDTQLDYIKNKPSIPSLRGYATEEYVNEQTSGKLDASAYHEYSAGLHLSLQDYVFNVTGLQEELNFDYDDLGKISAINGSALYGNGEEPIEYSAGEHIGIESDVISVTGLENLSAGPNVSIYEVDGHLEISAAAGGGGEGQTYYPGQYVNIDAGNYINVTGLQPSGKYQPAGDYAYTSALSVYAKASALSATYATNKYVNNKFVFNSAYKAPVQSDWIEDDVDDLAYIKNKPTPIGLIAGPGILLEDQTSAVMISCTASAASGGPATSGYYTDLAGNTFFKDEFTYTYDGHFRMGSMEKAMVPVSNVSSDEGKVPVVYVRDGRCYYLLERIIPTYTSATNGNILGVQNNTLAWINNPVKIVADSADIPASGSSDNILYVVAAD